MSKAIGVFFVFLFYTGSLFSQGVPIVVSNIFPGEGASLHYRIIGFSFRETSGATKYTLEIATGSHISDDLFNKQIVVTKESKSNKIIADVPSFGERYTWRIITHTSSGKTKGQLHYFSTMKNSLSDPTITRFRVIQEAAAYKDAYVFLDCTQTLYDMNGNPVWFIPGNIREDNLFETNFTDIQDLKLSQAGTITFIRERSIQEINYNGLSFLPPAAPGDAFSANDFHHTFTRLKNGHYMVLNYEMFPLKNKDAGTRKAMNADDSAKFYRQIRVGTVEEYDNKGKLVWVWKSSDYIRQSDILSWLQYEKGLNLDIHMNAFFFDEESKAIYIGYRDINRILKIQYPSGKVLNTYGKLFSESSPHFDNGLFCKQHSIVSDNGHIYVYNNNGCNSPALPKIMILKEPMDNKGADGLKAVWEYEFKLDLKRPDNPPMASPSKMRPKISRGGNMYELPGDIIFTSLSSPYSNAMLVDKNKQVLWNSAVERWDTLQNRWNELPTYRASIIPGRKQLEELIWAAQEKR